MFRSEPFKHVLAQADFTLTLLTPFFLTCWKKPLKLLDVGSATNTDLSLSQNKKKIEVVLYFQWQTVSLCKLELR